MVEAFQYQGNLEEFQDWIDTHAPDLRITGGGEYETGRYVFVGKEGQDSEWGILDGEYLLIDGLGEIGLLTEREFTKRYYRRPL